MKHVNKLFSTPNAAIVKMYNKRIQLVYDKHDKDGYILELLTMSGDVNLPRAKHLNLRNKVAVTSMKISREAVEGLYLCLADMLKRDYDREVQEVSNID